MRTRLVAWFFGLFAVCLLLVVGGETTAHARVACIAADDGGPVQCQGGNPCQTRKTCADYNTDTPPFVPVQCGTYPDGCGGFLNCGTCPPPQGCVGGRCQTCIPKTCMDVTGQCHGRGQVACSAPGACSSTGQSSMGGTSGPGAGGEDASGDGSSDGSSDASGDASEGGTTCFAGIPDGCGGFLCCACPNGFPAANVVCNVMGICAPPECTATNPPEPPNQFTFPLPMYMYGFSLPKFFTAPACRGLAFLGLPTVDDEISYEHNSTINAGPSITWAPVCKKTAQQGGRNADKVNICGYVIKIDASFRLEGVEEHCPWCDPSDNTNKCTSEWAHKQNKETIDGSAHVGAEWKFSPADLIRKILPTWLSNKMGRFYDWINRFAGIKAGFSAGPFTRDVTTDDVRGQGTNPLCPATGQNCTTKNTQWGLSAAGNGKFYFEFPPGSNPGIFELGFWFKIQISLEIGISLGVYANKIEKTGMCPNQTCYGIGGQAVISGKVGGKVKVIAFQGGINWIYTCRASGSINWCLPGGPTPDGEARCGWSTNQFGGN